MHVRLFNVRHRKASQRNTLKTTHNHDPYAILSQLDTEFDSFGHDAHAHDVTHVLPGLVAHDSPDGPVVQRKAA